MLQVFKLVKNLQHSVVRHFNTASKIFSSNNSRPQHYWMCSKSIAPITWIISCTMAWDSSEKRAFFSTRDNQDSSSVQLSWEGLVFRSQFPPSLSDKWIDQSYEEREWLYLLARGSSLSISVMVSPMRQSRLTLIQYLWILESLISCLKCMMHPFTVYFILQFKIDRQSI